MMISLFRGGAKQSFRNLPPYESIFVYAPVAQLDRVTALLSGRLFDSFEQ